jgi:hypothetical protein
MRKDEKTEVTPEFVNMSKEILYPQIQGVTLRLRGTRPASHLARPGKQVMMAPHVLHDDGGSHPLTEARRRQQGPDSPDSCASTGLKRSSDGHNIT